jgi:putative flippase GtrA
LLLLKADPVASDLVKMTPAAILDRVTGGRGTLAIKYSMVSVVGVLMGQSLLFLFVDLLDYEPTWSNVAAVMITAVPVFLLNKKWVWSADGKLSFRREVFPFWVFTGAGLALSTGFVALADNISDGNTLLIKAANLAGFGVLWVAKFLFLDQVMFGRPEVEEVLSQEAPAT